MKKFWQKPAGPSEEAQEARKEAAKLRERSDAIFQDREYLLKRNHFAERIRLIYEGR